MKNQNTAQPETAPATAHTPKWTHEGCRILMDGRNVAVSHDKADTLATLANEGQHIPALISERDRLRDALEKLSSQAGIVRIYDHLVTQENCDTGDAHFCMSLEQARSALANTTPSESARLREINAELMTALNDASDSLNVFLNGISGEELRQPIFRRANSAADKAALALKKAKDAQG